MAITGRITLPGVIANNDLPDATENPDYSVIAALPGLVHFLDYTKVIQTSPPLTVEEHVNDARYARRSGFANNPSISAINGQTALLFNNTFSEITSPTNINWAADWSLAFAIERSAGTGTLILGALSASTENGQFYLNGAGGEFLIFASGGGIGWTAAFTNNAVATGAKAVFVMAYDSATRTLVLRRDGAAAGSAVASAPLAAARLYLGRADATNQLKLGHLFLFNTDLSDSANSPTRTYVESYLKTKYGIA